MTKFQEFPLRPAGQAWPGLNTKGGRIDPGQGQLEDGSINAIINEADILEKRSGIVRGLEERFADVVCGLFSYADECNNEYLIVADASPAFSIRQPFELPVNANSDAYPIDGFDGDLDTDNWSNTDEYQTVLSRLRLIDNADILTTVPESRLMQWFKAASNLTYFVQIEYVFDLTKLSTQTVAIAVRRNGDNFVQAEINWDGTNYDMKLYLSITGSRTLLLSQPLDGVALGTGFLTLTYNDDRTATVRAVPSGGSIEERSEQINSVQEAALGLNSAIGLAGPSSVILQVNGGPV